MAPGAKLHLCSKVTGKHLRIGAGGAVDAKGGKGCWATFHVRAGSRPGTVLLQNSGNSAHWLSFDGHSVKGSSKGNATAFRAMKGAEGVVAFKSEAGLWLAVTKVGAVIAKEKNTDIVGQFVSFTPIPAAS